VSEEIYEEEEAGDRPESGDLVTYDHEYFYEIGKAGVFDVKLKRNFSVRVPRDEDWQPHVKAFMDKDQYWPNVWFIDDHGGHLLLSLEAKRQSQPKPCSATCWAFI
jgi:hypothetical protein